jgi:putative phosphoesterase
MASRLVKKSATFALRDDGSATLAVVADTHSQPHAATHERLAALAPDAILHAGDIGDSQVIAELERIAPVFVVRGNIDGHAEFPDVLTLDLVSADAGGDGEPDAAARQLRIYLTHIAVNGPRLRSEVARAARSEHAALVICGHSHVPFIGKERDLTVFNPGSCGPRRFQLPIVFGTLRVSPRGVRLAHVDCETGSAWMPPG